MQCGDETDTDSNAYLVIEIQFVKVSQDGQISRIVSVPLRVTLDILTAPKPKSQKTRVTLLSPSRHCSRTTALGTHVLTNRTCIK